jgi:hypothetical protein
MGLIWGAAWGFVGGVPRWVFGVETDVPIPLLFGAFGFISGVVFSGVLALTEGRRRFDQMSLRRFAGWGAVGGLLFSAVWANALSLPLGEMLALSFTLAIASAGCAAGSLALARRARGPELESGEDKPALLGD